MLPQSLIEAASAQPTSMTLNKVFSLIFLLTESRQTDRQTLHYSAEAVCHRRVMSFLCNLSITIAAK